jgi:hypothetical protein
MRGLPRLTVGQVGHLYICNGEKKSWCLLCADALALAGLDYLVVGPKVLAALAEAPTLQARHSTIYWRFCSSCMPALQACRALPVTPK